MNCVAVFSATLQVDAIVFLVDAVDKERFSESKKELDGLLSVRPLRLREQTGHGVAPRGASAKLSSQLETAAAASVALLAGELFRDSAASSFESTLSCLRSCPRAGRLPQHRAVPRPREQDRHPARSQRGALPRARPRATFARSRLSSPFILPHDPDAPIPAALLLLAYRRSSGTASASQGTPLGRGR